MSLFVGGLAPSGLYFINSLDVNSYGVADLGKFFKVLGPLASCPLKTAIGPLGPRGSVALSKWKAQSDAPVMKFLFQLIVIGKSTGAKTQRKAKGDYSEKRMFVLSTSLRGL